MVTRASLVPGDVVLNIFNADVAITGIYQGRRRMTLTYPIINRSRRVLWVVTGAEKADPLARLIRADRSIPAGSITQDQCLVLADDSGGALVPNKVKSSDTPRLRRGVVRG